MFNLPREQEERGKHLHQESVVVDTLAGRESTRSTDYILRMLKKGTELV